jgi:hypothetical protein
VNVTYISELVYKFTRTGGRNTDRSIQDGQTKVHEEGISLELPILNAADDDNYDGCEMS